MRRSWRIAGVITAVAVVAGVVALAGSGAGAQTAPSASITPDAVVQTITAGGSIDVTKTVQTPVLPSTLDVYLLADTTGSMGGYLDAVHLSSESIFAQITAQAPGAQFGVGQYQDFNVNREGDVCDLSFQNQASISADATATGNAINAWSAHGGCDTPEAQLYALDRLADPSNPAGFRAAASKVIVWFGDAPGHVPVCSALTGLPADITEASVTAKLQAAGIELVVVSIGGGIDEDPTSGANDYQPTCPTPGGTAGQGTRMASATGGIYTTVNDPAELAPAILAAIRDVELTVSLVADCPAPLAVTFEPASQQATSGSVVTFDEHIAAAEDAPSGVVDCTVSLVVNGAVVPDVLEHNSITIEAQPPIFAG